MRVLSALLGIPLIICAVWKGGLILLSFIAIVMILGLLEMLNLLKNLGLKPSKAITIVSALLLLVATYWQDWRVVGMAITLTLVAHLLYLLKDFPRYSPIDAAAGWLAVMYLGLFTYIFLISTLPEGTLWLYMLLVGTWASDTFAYFVGKTFGKHKLTPNLSPKKTWEGAMGGLLGSVVAVYIYSAFVISLPLNYVFLLGLLISITSQFGDLVESTLKRHASLKDSGNIIPGHGGMLDRFDSMLLSAPLVYYFVSLFII
ncbi:phosphatidate cytidylyltransferase [Peptococcaceae bacterium 1198_IL3148]